MNKIYIGDQEINTGGGSGGGSEFNPSDYVDTSTWNEHEKVIASAIVDLKSLEDKIEEFDLSIQAQENALLAEVHVVEQTKADASTVYTKSEIDYTLNKSDKVVAAALASLDDRVSTLETSSGSGGSGDSFDPTDINSSISDISTRVSAIENDYVVVNDISTFVTQSVFDASFNALDASALVFDASIKELAQSSGGGGTSPFEYIDSKYAIINKDSLYNANAQLGKYAVILNGYNYSYNYTKATGWYSIAGGLSSKATGTSSIALGTNTTASGENSVALSTATASGYSSFAAMSGANALSQYSVAIGYNTNAKEKSSVAIGYSTNAKKLASVAIGYCINSLNNYEIATGYFNNSINNNTTFGSELNTLGSIGNGYDGSQTIRHNAFEVRQSGDIYIPDVSAAGEYYEKPMINLQQKIYELEARIAALESGNS